jgi:hypothetical protein
MNPNQSRSAVAVAAACARSARLADRLETHARALIEFAQNLSPAQWQQAALDGDRRPVGVIVHHVASVYPIEIQLAQAVAAGTPMTDVTWPVIHTMNANHFIEAGAVTREAAIQLLKKNSTDAAEAIRALSEEQLDRAVPMSLYGNAVLTCQFFLEDHAIRHSMHHLARLRAIVTA